MDLLEAVNVCLIFGCNEQPISSLSASDADSAKIQTIIEQVRKEICAKPHVWNTETIDLNRQVDGTVPLSADILQAKLSDPYIIRDQKIYNPDTRTFVMTQDFDDTECVMDLDIDEMPDCVARWISWEATKRYSGAVLGPTGQMAVIEEQLMRARKTVFFAYPDIMPMDNVFGIGAGDCGCGSRWVACC